MRRAVVASLVVALMVGVSVPGVAQEEDAAAQRVEVPEAGLAIAFPADWGVDIEMRQREDWGLIDDPDGEPVGFWDVLYASAGGRPWCDVTWYPEHPMSLADHALLFEESMTPDSDVERTIELSTVELPVGEAYRFDIHNGPTDDFSTTYLLGPGPSRHILECMADTRDANDWLWVAQTIELAQIITAGEPEALAVAAQDPAGGEEPGLERVEVPEAGMSMAFPMDWDVIVQMVRREADLPPDLSASGPVDFWSVIEAGSPDGSTCELVMYGRHPLPFAEHVEWIRGNFEAVGVTDSTPPALIELPLGEAARFDLSFEDEGFGSAYLFDVAAVRYQLRCGSLERPADDWLSFAATLEPIPLQPVLQPQAGAAGFGEGVDVRLDFDTVVSVVRPGTADFPTASLMNATCAFALWVPAEDGSATEWLACSLSDEPIEPAEYQGVPPAETVTASGAECIWRSDYWYQTDRTEVVASAYELLITPGGQVYGRSTYPAQPLDCAAE